MKITASPFYHAKTLRDISSGNKELNPDWFTSRRSGPCGVYLWGFYTGNFDDTFDENSFKLDEEKLDFSIYYIGKIDHKINCGCESSNKTKDAVNNVDDDSIASLAESKKKSNIGERMLQEWAWLFGGFYPTFKFNHFVDHPTDSNIWLYQQADIGKGPLLHKSEGMESNKNYLKEYPYSADFLNSQKHMKDRLIFCWLAFDLEGDENDKNKKEKIKNIEKKLHYICGENTLGIGNYKLGKSIEAENAFKELESQGPFKINFDFNIQLKKYLFDVAKHTKKSHDKYFDKVGPYVNPYPPIPTTKNLKPRYKQEINFITDKKLSPNGLTYYNF
jgi:hypothetical protein